MRKEEFRKIILPCLVFCVGMLSVSIANIFGNHYGFVAILAIVLSAIYVYDILDNEIKIMDRVVTLSLMGVVVFLELFFFVINDLFNISVYTVGKFGFFDICVLLSQFISISGIIYLLVNVVLNNRKIDVEIMENDENTYVNNSKTEDYISTEQKVEKVEEVEEKHEKVEEEVRFIQNNNKSQKVPFMEEEN